MILLKNPAKLLYYIPSPVQLPLYVILMPSFHLLQQVHRVVFRVLVNHIVVKGTKEGFVKFFV